MKWLLDADSPTQRTYFHEEGGEHFIHQHTPGHINQAILDQNAADRRDGVNPLAKGRHAARIPLHVRDMWRREWETTHSDTFTWPTYLVMKVNSADYKFLRTGVDKI